MRHLWRQNWFVAYRSGLLWLICAVMFAFSVAVRTAAPLDQLGAVPGLGIVYAFFAASYLGDAGTSGRLDGQIICGKPRTWIFVSAWLTLLASFVLILLCTVAGDLVGGLISGSVEGYAAGWLVFLAGMIFNAAAYAALFALIGMLIVGRRPGRGTATLIVCVVVFIAMMICVNSLQDALMEPEYYAAVGSEEETLWYEYPVLDISEYDPADLVENHDYVPEPLRSTYWNVLRFMPLSQAVMLLDYPGISPDWEEMREALFLWLDALVLTLGAGALGALLFQRRELD